MPRFHVSTPLATGRELALPAGAARHVQVLRLQPGQSIVLFNGTGGEWQAEVMAMGRSEVRVRVGAHSAIEREALRPVHLAVGVMASERMDWAVEKATELGAASFTPMLAERSALRLAGERALKKHAHWQAVAIAASEQSGRNRLMDVREQLTISQLIGAAQATRWMLSLDPHAPRLHALAASLPADMPVTLLSGPEGGLSPREEDAARAAGFAPVHLGPRVLRAETAPVAALSVLLSSG